MENEVTQRIKEFQKAMGLSENKLSKELRIKQNTLNKQLKDGGSGASITTVAVILQTYPNLSAEWLLRGNCDMFIDCQHDKDDTTSTKTIENLSVAIKGQQDTINRLLDENNRLHNELRQFYVDRTA